MYSEQKFSTYAGHMFRTVENHCYNVTGATMKIIFFSPDDIKGKVTNMLRKKLF